MMTKNTNAAAVLADRAAQNAERLNRIAAFADDPTHEAHLRSLIEQPKLGPLRIATTPRRAEPGRSLRLNRPSGSGTNAIMVTLGDDDLAVMRRYGDAVEAALGARPSRGATLSAALALLDRAISVTAANDDEPLRGTNVSTV